MIRHFAARVAAGVHRTPIHGVKKRRDKKIGARPLIIPRADVGGRDQVGGAHPTWLTAVDVGQPLP